MMTKVNTHSNSLCSKSFLKEVKAITAKLDNSAKFALKNTEEEYHVARQLSDIFPELKNKRPRGWSKGKTYNNLDGIHTDKGIYLFEIKERRNPRYIISHETGHALDSAFYNITGVDFSNTKGYITEYNKDIINLDKNCKKYNISKDKLNIEYFIQGSRKDKPTIGGLRETFLLNCTHQLRKMVMIL